MTKARLVRVLLVVVLCAVAVFLGQCAWDQIKTYYGEAVPRPTAFPSSARPDLVCLTWSGDPRTTQAIQWRTSPEVETGVVQYGAKDAPDAAPQEAAVERVTFEDPQVQNDPINHHFTAVLEGLEPGKAYRYRVGTEGGAWTDWASFTTAPAHPAPFSFVYMGDVQVGYDAWGALLRAAQERRPNAAFYILAGDLVNRGNHREEWDHFFHASRGVFDHHPLVPAIGNHECHHGADPEFYLGQFALPLNGVEGLCPERTYSFEYGNALFVVLDSNRPPEAQQDWLESRLRDTEAVWKFVVCHHPAYSSKSTRDNPELRDAWCSLFDRYHVDIVFQGHDHAYLRTQPMRAREAVASPAEGTIYVIAVAGTKFYRMEMPEYAAAGAVHTSTYQTVDIQTSDPNRLEYRAYTADGEMIDQFVIEKTSAAAPHEALSHSLSGSLLE